MANFGRGEIRKIFSEAGLEIPPKDVIGQICDLHTESADGFQETIKDLQTKLTAAEHERDALKGKQGDNADLKAKLEKAEKALADYKAEVTAKESKAAKEAAAKAYFEGKNITGANLDIAMRGAREEIGALELDGDKIKDTTALDALVSGTYAGLVVTTTKQGVNTATPPGNLHSGSVRTKAEIMQIKDTGERQKAWDDYIAAQQQKGQ